MNCMKSVSSILVLSLLTLSAHADVTSSLAGEKLFIKISKTSDGASPEDTRIKFEKCQSENPAACDPIGSRDYSFRELREQREVLVKEAEKEGAVGFSPFIGALLGVVGGAGTGGVAGGYTGAALAGSGEFASLGGAIVGLFMGAVVVAVVGGIVVYKVVRHHKKKKAKKLDKEASTVEEQVIEDQPVSIQTDIDMFAKSLSDILASLPAGPAPTLP
jgi:hypothetical protein